jgi:hypothetical protein
MPELIRSIVGKLRALAANRRRVPRFAVRLEAEVALSVSVPGAKKGSAGEERSLRLAGYTRDISADGLGLIVPAIRIGGDYITGDNRILEITLKLPGGAVRIYGKPVRYTQLDEDATDKGYLVGVHIESMSEADRARFATLSSKQ